MFEEAFRFVGTLWIRVVACIEGQEESGLDVFCNASLQPLIVPIDMIDRHFAGGGAPDGVGRRSSGVLRDLPSRNRCIVSWYVEGRSVSY